MRELIMLLVDENTMARMETEAIANDPNPKLYGGFKEFMDEAG